MTQEQHPITPPLELVRQWTNALDCPDMPSQKATYIATQAARWGADQELEACCHLLRQQGFDVVDDLRAARRPKPPSLKEQALRAIGAPAKIGEARVIEHREHELIRRALEALPDD